MAGVVDILLRILGDSRDAVRAVDDVGTAADRTTTKVANTESTFRRLYSTVAQTFAAGGAILTAAGTANDLLDQVTGGRQSRVAAGVGQAGTRAELEAAFAAQVREAVIQQRGSPLEQLLGREISLPGGLFGTDVSRADRDRIAAQEVEKLVASDPNRAAALAAMGGPYSAAITAALARRQRAATFDSELKGAAAPVIVVNTGVGDPNRVGDEVRAALERAQRNNGRYTTTLNRP